MPHDQVANLPLVATTWRGEQRWFTVPPPPEVRLLRTEWNRRFLEWVYLLFEAHPELAFLDFTLPEEDGPGSAQRPARGMWREPVRVSH